MALNEKSENLSFFRHSGADGKFSGTSQALMVRKGAKQEGARAEGWENRDGWRLVKGPFRAVAGRNGFVRPGEKREADGRTPSGVFPLEAAFGYARGLSTSMPYLEIGDENVWVDDPASPDYNQWKTKGETKALSFEEMHRADGLYEVGIVVGYNRNPVVAGLGSAIFFHIWAGEGKSTSGCIGMSREDLLTVLAWLDPLKNPVAVLGC
jgi:L,D-peptidoglycan transpeptidase YkuD (ErfK/YbiS/YcfS/YnhG family)